MDNAEFEDNYAEDCDLDDFLKWKSMQDAYEFVTSDEIKDGSMAIDIYIQGMITNKKGFLEASIDSEQEIENYIGIYKYIKSVSNASTLSEVYSFISNGFLDERITHLWMEEGLLYGLEKYDCGNLSRSILYSHFQKCD